ncbi:MAG: DUF3467 domain-containing protein [Chloroflexota bacterium]
MLPGNRPTPAPQLPMDLQAGLAIEYANMVRIAHSPSELVLDFAQLLPGTQGAQVTSRIVMSPLGAKLFLGALAENISRYEAAFGEIAVPGNHSLAEHLFRPPAPPTHPGGPPPPDKPAP